jgi:hypothetical protein
MNYIYSHIDHITVPAAMLLSLMTVITVYVDQRRRKTKANPPYVSRVARGALIIAVVLVAILLGMALAHRMV